MQCLCDLSFPDQSLTLMRQRGGENEALKHNPSRFLISFVVYPMFEFTREGASGAPLLVCSFLVVANLDTSSRSLK